ncbi:hypothetical protein BH20VER3_BH20VER3_13730 [soil metagenome]
MQPSSNLSSGADQPVTIYRYGPLAWFWRILIAGFLFLGAATLLLGIHFGSLLFLFISFVFCAPSLFFGLAVAVRVGQLGNDQLQIWTLLFWRRHLAFSQLGAVRLRTNYHSETGSIYAPALWVRVPGGLPIYLDLLATIPDRRAFAKVFRVPLDRLPH